MKRRLTCSVKYFCLGAFLIFLGSVLLCGLGFTVVLPHEATRDWPAVTCHVVNSIFSARICSCEHQERDVADTRQCLDSYPCLHIRVTYNVNTASGNQIGFNSTTIAANDITASNDKTSLEMHNLSQNQTITGSLYRSWADEFFKTVSNILYRDKLIIFSRIHCHERSV